jgi:hypothetical protein
MKIKIFAVVVAIAVLVGIAAVIVSASPTRQMPSAVQLRQQERFAKRLDAVRRAPVHCQTLKCLNKQLTKLSNFVDFFYGCVVVYPVSQYGDTAGSQGYVYDPGGGDPTFDTAGIQYTLDKTTDAYRYMATFKKACVT